MEHTKGPWTYQKENYGGARYTEDALKIVMPGNDTATVSGTHQNQNAMLISAAPDLLEALKIAVMANELTEGMTGEEIEQCRKVIGRCY